MAKSNLVVALASAINLKYDFPFINEAQEQSAIEWILGYVVSYLPPDMEQILLDATDGLTDEEIARHASIFTKLITDRVDIPWVPESMEVRVIRPVVEEALSFLRAGLSLEV
jgi:hypothetical protein